MNHEPAVERAQRRRELQRIQEHREAPGRSRARDREHHVVLVQLLDGSHRLGGQHLVGRDQRAVDIAQE